MDHPNYPLVNLLGADAVGKTSVCSELSKLLGAAIIKTPGDAWDGLRYKAEEVTPYARFCFYAAAVASSMGKVRSALSEGPVILDRSIQCTVAFHAAMGVKIPHDIVELLDIVPPTLSVLLTVNPATARMRMEEREKKLGKRPDHKIENNGTLQEKVVEIYRTLHLFGFGGTFLPVEIATDGKSPADVAKEIMMILQK